MNKPKNCGFLILDRKGEYIQDTIDQRGNVVFGLQNHENAQRQMVIVSKQKDYRKFKEDGLIFDYLEPQFNIADIEPIDLADFLAGLTPQQASLIRDYAYTDSFYTNLLGETPFGQVDNRNWFKSFPGLYELDKNGKQLIKGYEASALAEGRTELTDEEFDKVQPTLGGTKPGVLERAAGRIKRFCLNPFFGRTARGPEILCAPTCVAKILEYLAAGKFVFIDMRGQQDDDYTLIAAIFARKLLTINKERDDKDQIRACIIMEEAHNILSEEELSKGDGAGSVFVELAREGRSFKLGFILVTQQPDARSIAPQVIKTIDTVIAFNMPPEDAKHLQRLKSGFASLDGEISNAKEFHGVAIADSGPILFRSAPVDKPFMENCSEGSLEELIKSRGEPSSNATFEAATHTIETGLEERLAELMRRRQENIQPVALATLKEWKGLTVVDQTGDSTEEEADIDATME